MTKLVAVLLVAACGGPQGPVIQGSAKDTDRDGVRDIDDKCAYDSAPGTHDGCPEKASTITVTGGSADRDGDGVLDTVDKCVEAVEDYDGFEDTDGCPDPDNDRDSILDRDDKCPNIAEIRNGVEDDDGCPESDGAATGSAAPR